MPHALLILYINNKAMIMDNQVNEIRDSSTTDRYRILYSINRKGWWRPATKLANIINSTAEDMDRMEPAGGDDSLPYFPKACLTQVSLPECINAIEPAAR